MIQQLTTSDNLLIWVNLAQIQMMRTVPDVTKGYPSTQIIFENQQTLYVFESPAEIAILANTPEQN
jgi:hypothetical protein